MNQTQVLPQPIPNEPPSDASGRFALTQWTVVLKARDEKAPGAQEAMEDLARTYWQPLYRFIRREGYDHHEAQDLTQEFYNHFQERHLLERVKQRRGKFRSFLLTCLKHFLSDQRDREGALKRGGGMTFVALDALESEERDAVEPAVGLTADQIYERRWVEALLVHAGQRLRKEQEGRTALCEALLLLPQDQAGEATYAEIARRLGMTEAAVKSKAYRLRLRYQEILREEIGRTVGSREEIDEEIRHMMGVLGA